ncbi:hypothetical protein VIGAN_05143400 [Vigna angularis var. angularis]|uniref:Uncharacterized protein n=1 Tax=Vigna angularis var. angularis TaxID=157739 RepID=A0A0S3S5A1_PHAAN|nr:hypothetical protein VIGAN_05143400 [Vigna angularis var. angularis]
MPLLRIASKILHSAGNQSCKCQHRTIFATAQLQGSWMEKVKNVITGQKTTQSQGDAAQADSDSFTLLRQFLLIPISPLLLLSHISQKLFLHLLNLVRIMILLISGFADEMKNAKRIGAFKEFMVGRSSEATFSSAFEKYEAIIRYLGVLDPTGENLQTAQKQEAAKHCSCTIADVENALAKFTWAKEAQKKIEKLKEEGKPLPKSFTEVQKLVGSTPLDLARSNLAQSGQISRNALCPCGSKKRYKRCCGKD